MKVYDLTSALENKETTKALFIHNRALDIFPEEIFQLSNLVQLELSLNRLSSIPEKILQLQQLQIVNFNKNRFQAIPAFICQLSHLQKVSFNKNKIVDFSNIVNHKNIQSISLIDNRIEHFPELDHISKLSVLQLSNNNINALPVHMNRLRNLTVLEIASNQLTRLAAAIGKCTDLQKLNIAHNKIKTIPRSIKNLQQLSSLIANNNQINQLHADFAKCKNLRTIDLANNKLKVLPDAFCQLKQLRHLDLSHNKLTDLPDNIGQVRSLSELNLAHNTLENLPNSLGQISFLFKLLLNDNILKILPVHFTRLTSLSILNLANNQFDALPEEIGQLKKLKHLELQNNQLQYLPDSFQNLKELQHLNLYKNPINTFPKVLLQLDNLTQIKGLKNLLSIAQKKQLIAFLKHCKTQQIKATWRIPYYELLTKKLDELEYYDLELLLAALYFPMTKVKENAKNLIVKYHSTLKGKPRLSAGATISFHGDSHLKLRETTQKLKAFDIKLSRKITTQTTHIIIGYNAIEYDHLLSRPFHFLTEQMLNDFIWNSEHSTFKFDLDKNSLANLAQLLTSKYDENIKVAIQMMKGIGVDQSLITELFLAYKFTNSSTLKKELKKILILNADPNTMKAIQYRGALRGHVSEIEIKSNIVHFTTNSVLDGIKIAQFLVEHFQRGQLYLDTFNKS